MTSVGEALIAGLAEERGVDIVFGIPGVHTLELYRGLPTSGIRHVTPRHEQGAGFMADGWPRLRPAGRVPRDQRARRHQRAHADSPRPARTRDRLLVLSASVQPSTSAAAGVA